jgi:hypothetical protein
MDWPSVWTVMTSARIPGRVHRLSTGSELIGDLDSDTLERSLPKAGNGGRVEPRQEAATAIAAGS